MPQQTIATGLGANSATGLSDQLFSEPDVPVAEQKTEVVPPKTEDASEESTDENTNDSGASEEAEGGESTEEGTEPEAGDKKPKAESKSWKIGNQSFATPDDMAREAQRVVGRNAILAGDIAKRDTVISDKETQIAELQAQIQEWNEWARANENGEARPMPDLDPDKIADKVAERMEKRSSVAAKKEAIKNEFVQMQSLGNYAEVEDVIYDLSNKVNPLTEKHFTPFEAYDYAVAHRGLQNLRKVESKGKPAAPVPPPKVERKIVKSAAARPAAGRQGTVPPSQKQPKSFAEEMLDEQFGTRLY